MSAYRLTVFGFMASVSGLALGGLGGYIIATWFGLRG